MDACAQATGSSPGKFQYLRASTERTPLRFHPAERSSAVKLQCFVDITGRFRRFDSVEVNTKIACCRAIVSRSARRSREGLGSPARCEAVYFVTNPKTARFRDISRLARLRPARRKADMKVTVLVFAGFLVMIQLHLP